MSIAMPAIAQPLQTLTLRLRVIVEPDGKGFHAYCPAFKGLHVDGDSEQEALQRASEAALVYLNSLAATQEALPIGPDCVVEVDKPRMPLVPPGALLRYLELKWPSLQTVGIR